MFEVTYSNFHRDWLSRPLVKQLRTNGPEPNLHMCFFLSYYVLVRIKWLSFLKIFLFLAFHYWGNAFHGAVLTLFLFCFIYIVTNEDDVRTGE